ncbi:MAG TPA: DUF1638 domain-containing protein [Candidatus Limnocylindrales bacterium]
MAADAAALPNAPRPTGERVLVVACGALAREILGVLERAGLDHVDVACLSAQLHMRPGRIADAVAAKIRERRDGYDRVFVAYADCGTGGALDRVLAEPDLAGIERLPGAHCYELYAGAKAFEQLADEEPGTFYLTDFLTRSFDALVIKGLGLDRHPELLELYFGNYRRLVYLAQSDDPALVDEARAAAERLGLEFELRRTGYGELEPFLLAGTSGGTSAATTTGFQAGAA